jgi:hypothetical protein
MPTKRLKKRSRGGSFFSKPKLEDILFVCDGNGCRQLSSKEKHSVIDNTTHIFGQKFLESSVKLEGNMVYLCSYRNKIITNYFVTIQQIGGGLVFFPVQVPNTVNCPVKPEIKNETVYVPSEDFTRDLVTKLKEIKFSEGMTGSYAHQYNSSDSNRTKVCEVLNKTVLGILVECKKILQEPESTKLLSIISGGLDLRITRIEDYTE